MRYQVTVGNVGTVAVAIAAIAAVVWLAPSITNISHELTAARDCLVDADWHDRTPTVEAVVWCAEGALAD